MRTQYNSQNIVGIVLLLISVIYLYYSFQLQEGTAFVGPSFLPTIAGSLLFICSVVFLIQNHKESKSEDTDEEEDSIIIEKRHYLLAVCLIVYLIILPLLGFLISTLLFMFVINMLYGFRGFFKPLLSSVVVTISIYLLFQTLLGVPLNLI